MTEFGAFALRRWSLVVLALATTGAGIGLALSRSYPGLPGSEHLTVEDVVDVVALLVFGVLGAVLVYRDRAAGLGRALILMACLESLVYLLGGLADRIAAGRTEPPVAAQICNVVSQAAFIGVFALFTLAPLLLFPTGRLPSPRWRFVVWLSAAGAVTAIASLVFAPGPVDPDVPAWGENPIGIDALAGVVGGLEAAGLVMLGCGLIGGLAAVATRWVRYRGSRRRQMAWFTLGVVVVVVGLVTDFGGKSLAFEVLIALVIFGSRMFSIAWPLLGPLGAAADAEDQSERPSHDQRTAGAAHR